MLLWLGLSVANIACYWIGSWMNLVAGVLLVAGFLTHFVAFIRCQPVICSQLIGGDGRETMILYIPGR
jgi:uncharacterized membrane protein YphA (DoxX/SURF4 family)